jgi:hypothetical protein
MRSPGAMCSTHPDICAMESGLSCNFPTSLFLVRYFTRAKILMGQRRVKEIPCDQSVFLGDSPDCRISPPLRAQTCPVLGAWRSPSPPTARRRRQQAAPRRSGGQLNLRPLAQRASPACSQTRYCERPIRPLPASVLRARSSATTKVASGRVLALPCQRTT